MARQVLPHFENSIRSGSCDPVYPDFDEPAPAADNEQHDDLACIESFVAWLSSFQVQDPPRFVALMNYMAHRWKTDRLGVRIMLLKTGQPGITIRTIAAITRTPRSVIHRRIEKLCNESRAIAGIMKAGRSRVIHASSSRKMDRDSGRKLSTSHPPSRVLPRPPPALAGSATPEQPAQKVKGVGVDNLTLAT